MKKYVLLAILLIAGMAAYPQATRSARQSTSKSSTAQKSVSSKSNSGNKSRGTVNRSSSQKSSGTVNRSSAQKSSGTVNRSASQKSIGTVNRSSSQKNTGTVNRSLSQKSTGSVNRSSSQKTTGTVNRSSSGSSNVNRNAGSQSVKRSSNTQSGSRTEAIQRSTNRQTLERPNPAQKSSGATRTTEIRDPNRGSGSTSSANRTFREGRSTLTMDDGRVIKHDNDQVFRHNRYNLNYRDYHELRRSNDFIHVYNDYNRWRNRRVVRIVHNHYNYIPLGLEIRRMRYPYRRPVYIHMVWTPSLLHRFMYYYPYYENWRYDFGSNIEDVSSYDAEAYAGSVKRVYGKVEEVYYSPEDENYVLYFGAPFPYHDMTVVIPRHIAREISSSPKWYFNNEHVWVVGLIEMWEGKPEIVVHDEDQIRRY